MLELASWAPSLAHILQYKIPYACLLLVLPFVISRARNTTGDPYGSFHLSLNELPGENPDAPPKTEWLNMGYWKETDIFPEACLALALKLIGASRCKPASRVLDVGHGSGESLITLLTHPSAPTPSRLTGITSLPSHHARSKERIEALHLSDKTTLYLGDAVYRPGVSNHPLAPQSDVQYDAILALDCAYHFRTRDDFLRQSLAHLAPGGRIALADICIRLPWPSLSLTSRFLLTVLKIMHRQNCVSLEEYEIRMREMGYVDVKTEDVSNEVFPGFLRFLKSRGLGWYLFAKLMEINVPSLRFVIVSGARR
ncbi:S-adenosyl-L-methionine-dependent methyltransferase [Hymenopellis radicata]|nr:S-adenosyl-L-methionine-dependent methyltransferase [Hymenopellis radicata]